FASLDPELRGEVGELAAFVNISTEQSQRLLGNYQRAEQYLRQGDREGAVREVMDAIRTFKELNESARMVEAPEFYLYPKINVSRQERNIEMLNRLLESLEQDVAVLEVRSFYPTNVSLGLSSERAGFADVLNVSGRLYYRLNDTGIPSQELVLTLQNRSYTMYTHAGGFYRQSIVLDQYLERGSCDVRVVYTPSDVPASPARASKRLTVVSKATNMSVWVKPRDDAVSIAGNLTCEKIPLEGLAVGLVVDRRVYVATTNESGIFSLSIDRSAMKGRVHTVSAGFEPHNLAFLPSNATLTFELGPTSPTPTSPTPTSSIYVLAIVGLLIAAVLTWLNRGQAMRWIRSIRPAQKMPAEAEEREEPEPEGRKEEIEEPEVPSEDVLAERMRTIEQMVEKSPCDAVRQSYAMAREYISTQLGIEDDPSLTHLEFLELIKKSKENDKLRALTLLYERSAFSGTITSREDAMNALELARSIVGGNG
ncbi:MAG: hypothetical protein ACXQS9_03855, partial [Methermicoccaceae archaeon]